MTIKFERLTPKDLSKSAVVPQAIDNQWVPSRLLKSMITKRKSLSDVNHQRQKIMLKEWRRALVYSEQVIINRAFIFNNSIVVDDYDDKENKAHFKELLRQRVIIPYLYQEETPDQRPLFEISSTTWENWLDVIEDSQISCVRLSWGDQKEQFTHMSRTYHDFIQRLGGSNQAEQLAGYFSIKQRDLQAFKDALRSLAKYAFEKSADARLVTRNDLYNEFIVEPGTRSAEGIYRNEKFIAEIKQIVDLKYNVNLPDALGCYLLVPADSLPRAALGDLDDAVNSNFISENAFEGILYALRQLSFSHISGGLYIRSLDELSLADVVKIRQTDEIQAYRNSLRKLTDEPLNFSEESQRLLHRFESVNKVLTNIHRETVAQKWEPWVKFAISIGAKTAEIWINTNNPSEKLLSTYTSGAVSAGVSPFAIRLTTAAIASVDSDLSFSVDVMKGKIRNGRDAWEELIGSLRSTPGFREVNTELRQQDSTESLDNDLLV
jgi:virulence-associated protein VapD